MSSKSSIQVCIKVRPCERHDTSLWQVKEGRSIQLIDSQADPYVFDFVFDQDSNNHDVFNRMAKHIVHACLQGFNGTIFAYGQTSSGKTYTMMGDEQNPGVMVLAAKEIFNQIAQNTDREFLLRVGYIEIYNEKIYDLLNKKNQDLKIHEAATGVVSVNCEECIITSEEDLLQFLCLGNKERTVGETNMNERSSRSHAIFRIIIESQKTDHSDDAVIQSVLNLVDLAGSERADQTGARGARLKEGGHINRSLLFLSNVIKSLSENVDNKYISYRDSKLTRILQASLGGNAFTSIICTIKPSIMEESLSTLNFALRAKKIRIKPQLNEIVSDATMMKRLQQEIKELKERLAEEERNKESQIKVNQLQQRIKTDMLKIISSNSLNTLRNQKRRRTWCPTTSMLESGIAVPSLIKNVDGQMTRSQLPKPTLFPSTSHITNRGDNVPKTVSIFTSLDLGTDLIEEEFKPAELYNFGNDPGDFHTPVVSKLKSRELALSLTPYVDRMDTKSLEMVEKELMELQTFTNLEKQNGVRFDQHETLKEKLAIVTARRDELETERIGFMQLKNDITISNAKQKEYEERCDQLQLEVKMLTIANIEGNEKIEKYEQELQELRRNSEKIELLLKAEHEANDKIQKYEQELQELKQTVNKLEVENREAVILQFEYQSHKSKSQQREAELLSLLTSKDAKVEELQKSLDELAQETLRNTKEYRNRSICPVPQLNLEICQKCVDLENVKEQHEKSKTKFDNLFQEYEKLQEKLVQVSDELSSTQSKLNELEQLQISEATERQVTLSGLQAKYESVVEKYNNLQEEYVSLSEKADNFEKLSRLLQDANAGLQSEISALKQTVEEAESKLINGSESLELQHLKAQNVELNNNVAELQLKFDEMQNSYDELSNNLMESIQEGDSLRKECDKLKEELKKVTGELVYRSNGNSVSMLSSGIDTDFSEPDADVDIQHQFAQYSESLDEIELEYLGNNSRVFRAPRIKGQSTQHYKLCFKAAEKLVAPQFDQDQGTNSESICFKGLIRQHKFQIVELNQSTTDEQQNIENYIAQLRSEIAEKDLLLSSTESTINEMREQMKNLESALLEKSVIVNKVEDYQRQIETLEKQRAEMTIVCEELQEKVKECTINETLETIEGNGSISPPHSLAMAAEAEAFKETQSKLESRIENLLQQAQDKDNQFAKLQADMQELREHCIFLECAKEELDAKVKKDKILMERQAQKLLADEKLIDQLQEWNAQLKESFINAELSVTQSKQHLAELQASTSSKLSDNCESQQLKEEYEKRLNELQTALTASKLELEAKEKDSAEQLNQLQLEYMDKLEHNETANRDNFRKYKIEWEESKNHYEISLTKLKEKLALAEGKCQELSVLQVTNDQALQQLVKEKGELQSLYEASRKVVDELQIQLQEISHANETCSNKTVQELQSKWEAEVTDYKKLEDESQKIIENLCSENKALELTINESKFVITNLTSELEQLKTKAADQSKALDAAQQLAADLRRAGVQHIAEKKELEEKIDTLNCKLSDFVKELQEAKEKASNLNKLCLEHEAAERLLSESVQAQKQLSEQVKWMETMVDQAQKDAEAKNKLIEQLRSNMQGAENERDLAHKIQELEQRLLEEARQFQQSMHELHNSKVELELKMNSLESHKLELQASNEELSLKLQEANCKLEQEHKELLQSCNHNAQLEKNISQLVSQLMSAESKATESNDALNQMKASYAQLEERMANTREDANKTIAELRKQLETAKQLEQKLGKDCDELDSKLKDALDAKRMLEEEHSKCEAKLQELEIGQQLSEKLAKDCEELKMKLQDVIDAKIMLEEAKQLEEKLGNDWEELNNKLKDALSAKRLLEEEHSKCESKLQESVRHCKQLEIDQQLSKKLAEDCEELKMKLQDAIDGKFLLEEEHRKCAATLQESISRCKQLEIDQQLSEKLAKDCEELNIKLKAAIDAKILLDEEHKTCESKLEENINQNKQLAKDCEELSTKLKDANITKLKLEQEHHNCKTKLEENISQLVMEIKLAQEKVAECDPLRKSLHELKATHEQLEARMAATMEESIQLRKQVELAQRVSKELTLECEKLRSSLKTKEDKFKADKEQLHGTISCLLSEKSNLEEKLCTMAEIAEKIDNNFDTLHRRKSTSSNLSFDSNSSNSSLSGRKSLERECPPKKLPNPEAEIRRNRRLSTHDERRRQSYWNDTCEVACMTDPMVDTEMNRKLETCQRDLFISKSQVTALTIELKNHPLKEENAQLKKRLQEELDKGRAEVKRIRQKNQDLLSKINTLTASAAIANAKQVEPAPPKIMATIETQTESDLETAMKKLNDKYEDAIKLCRFRYNTIQKLQDQLKQNENTDQSNITSLTAGQITALKSQCEAYKNELKTLQEKYELAKRALKMRREEVEELRVRVSTEQDSPVI